MSRYRLPDGSETTDPDAMCAAWDEVAKPFNNIGLALHSFDPGIAFMKIEAGKIVDNSYFQLPLWAAKLIGEALKEKQACK